MIRKLTHTSLMVHNQDDAVKFFVDTLDLGLYKAGDNLLGMGDARWVTLGIKDHPGIEIILQATDWGPGGSTPAERAARVGKEQGFLFETDDCRGDIEKLRAKGVKIALEPQEYPWGIQAFFEDLYGNLHSISETPKVN